MCFSIARLFRRANPADRDTYSRAVQDHGDPQRRPAPKLVKVFSEYTPGLGRRIPALEQGDEFVEVEYEYKYERRVEWLYSPIQIPVYNNYRPRYSQPDNARKDAANHTGKEPEIFIFNKCNVRELTPNIYEQKDSREEEKVAEDTAQENYMHKELWRRDNRQPLGFLEMLQKLNRERQESSSSAISHYNYRPKSAQPDSGIAGSGSMHSGRKDTRKHKGKEPEIFTFNECDVRELNPNISEQEDGNEEEKVAEDTAQGTDMHKELWWRDIHEPLCIFEMLQKLDRERQENTSLASNCKVTMSQL